MSKGAGGQRRRTGKDEEEVCEMCVGEEKE